jgi:hypothetical protein
MFMMLQDGWVPLHLRAEEGETSLACSMTVHILLHRFMAYAVDRCGRTGPQIHGHDACSFVPVKCRMADNTLPQCSGSCPLCEHCINLQQARSENLDCVSQLAHDA